MNAIKYKIMVRKNWLIFNNLIREFAWIIAAKPIITVNSFEASNGLIPTYRKGINNQDNNGPQYPFMALL